jgi:hypothetical protein
LLKIGKWVSRPELGGIYAYLVEKQPAERACILKSNLFRDGGHFEAFGLQKLFRFLKAYLCDELMGRFAKNQFEQP